jgi:hypothetical protein
VRGSATSRAGALSEDLPWAVARLMVVSNLGCCVRFEGRDSSGSATRPSAVPGAARRAPARA